MDELGGGDDVEAAAAVDGFGGVAGVVEGGLDDGDTGVFVGDFIRGLGGAGDVFEAEGAPMSADGFGTLEPGAEPTGSADVPVVEEFRLMSDSMPPVVD